MKTNIVSIVLLFPFCLAYGGQVTGAVELDGYITTWGGVYYPRVKWAVKTAGGKFAGFGFVYKDKNPGPWFVNHPLTFTPAKAAWFSARAELGGTPKGFFYQLGPQFNAHAYKPVGKYTQYLIGSYLPEWGGGRPHNLLIAGAGRKHRLVGKVEAYPETYWRFFPSRGIAQSYGEAWWWFKPSSAKHFMFSPLLRYNKGSWMLGVGVRIF